jgi:hypothetical protein
VCARASVLAREELLDLHLALFGLEAAHGVDQSPPGAQQGRAATQQARLGARALVDVFLAGGVAQLRMPAEVAEAGARCVEQDRVEARLERGLVERGGDACQLELGRVEIGPIAGELELVEALARGIDGHDRPASLHVLGDLHGLGAHARARVEHPLARLRIEHPHRLLAAEALDRKHPGFEARREEQIAAPTHAQALTLLARDLG